MLFGFMPWCFSMTVNLLLWEVDLSSTVSIIFQSNSTTAQRVLKCFPFLSLLRNSIGMWIFSSLVCPSSKESRQYAFVLPGLFLLIEATDIRCQLEYDWKEKKCDWTEPGWPTACWWKSSVCLELGSMSYPPKEAFSTCQSRYRMPCNYWAKPAQKMWHTRELAGTAQNLTPESYCLQCTCACGLIAAPVSSECCCQKLAEGS